MTSSTPHTPTPAQAPEQAPAQTSVATNSDVLTDPQFLNLAESLLQSLEAQCDRINAVGLADIDNQRSGNMVTLTFDNQSQIVINLQKPLHEVWLAARAGGYHYRYRDGRWMDTKGAGEFFETLGTCASELSGVQLQWVP